MDSDFHTSLKRTTQDLLSLCQTTQKEQMSTCFILSDCVCMDVCVFPEFVKNVICRNEVSHLHF